MKRHTLTWIFALLLLGCNDDEPETTSDSGEVQSDTSGDAEDVLEEGNDALEDPTVEDPTVDDPTVEDPTVEDPTVEDPTVEDPTVDPDEDGEVPGTPIIADHTVVDRYDDIPEEYLAAVRTMWVNVLGESHSSGYRIGLRLLAESDERFAVVVTEEGEPEPYRTDALRVDRLRRTQYNSWAQGAGESDWYTNEEGMELIRNHIAWCESNDLHITAMGFGWCWDMTWHNGPDGDPDPVHNVRWAGSSEGGPDGDLRWGLDDDDLALTGNHVSLADYLEATQNYIDYCDDNGYSTVVFFTTGPVDGYSGESGVQRHIKHEAIREYVLADASRVLFDYADILAWSDSGEENLQSWTDGTGAPRQYQMIHDDNMLDLNGEYTEDGDHIGQRGALRLGKAMWWLLARLAGWDGQ